MSLLDTASRLHGKIRWGDGVRVLFYLPQLPASKRWQVFGMDSVRGQKMLRDFPHFVVGHYRPGVLFEDLVADMEFAVKEAARDVVE